ncbi:site-specific integrase [Paraburkholderia sacchari]|uniref:site-specific integrase n=1 Tax=Paraburkholderia sacchari TaxID=159450 RepID=UPI002467FC6B|nr:site-specific integrase [Paraburkholderia sacchari]
MTGLRATAKGRKLARVALSPLARYLAERRLRVLPVCWHPQLPAIGSLETDSDAAISVRLWMMISRLFLLAAGAIEADHAPLAEKRLHASLYWSRHTHATHTLGRGAELTTVRGDLRHSSVSTTSSTCTATSPGARQMAVTSAKTK